MTRQPGNPANEPPRRQIQFTHLELLALHAALGRYGSGDQATVTAIEKLDAYVAACTEESGHGT